MRKTSRSKPSFSLNVNQLFILLFLSIFLWSLLASSFPFDQAHAQGQTSISVNPARIIDYNYDPSSNFTVTLGIRDVTSLFQWQIKLKFDPSIIKCTVAYLPKGHIFEGEKIVPLTLEIDNKDGFALFSNSLSKYSSKTVDIDQGILCAVNFHVLERGRCQLILDKVDSIVFNADLEAIVTTLEDGIFDNRINGQILQNGASMFVDPPSITDPELTPSNNFTIYINVSEVTNLYTWQSKLLFDPSIMECIGAYYPEGHVFDGHTTVPVSPQINNTLGSILYGCTLLLESVDVEQGVLCAVEFHVLDTGDCDLVLDQEFSYLLDFDLEEIPATLESGYFNNLSPHDIAITDVVPSLTLVMVNNSVTVNVVVENQGTEPETFNVTAYYAGLIIDTFVDVFLGAGESDVLPFTWNTAGVAVGTYTISANATVVLGEEDIEDNSFADGEVKIVDTPIHDIAIINVTLSSTYVIVNGSVIIDVTVENQGTGAETINVTAYYEGIIIHTLTGVSLGAGESDVLTFTWDTTGVAVGTYVISANATVVDGEEDTADNHFIDGEVQIIETPPPPSAPALWIEPSTIVLTSADVGNRFNVTVWINMTDPCFTWQTKVHFNTTFLHAVRADYTGYGKSEFFSGHATLPVAPTIDNVEGFILHGETLLGVDSETGYGSLCWIEFELVTRQPGNLVLDFSPTLTYVLNPDLEDMTIQNMRGAEIQILPLPHDLGIIEVQPSKTLVVAGRTIIIDVVVENQGTEPEIFNVTTLYDGIIIDTVVDVFLDSGESDTLQFAWNTTGVAPGTYTIGANTTIVPGEEYTEDNSYTDGEVEIVETPIHDIAIKNVTSFPTSVAINNSLNIYVNVENQGTENETFDVTTYYDENIIDTLTGVSLNAGESNELTFTWDTSGVAVGTYVVSTNATVVDGEEDVVDNYFIDGEVEIVKAETGMFVHPTSVINYNLGPSSNFTVTIKATNITNFFTWQVKLLFDPTILECIDAYYPLGHVFDGQPFIPVDPVINNTDGYVFYGCSLLWESLDVEQGALCALEFHVLDTDSCSLFFDQECSFLLDFDLEEIPTALVGGSFDNRGELPDIAVVDVMPALTSVIVNETMTIDVVVENQGMEAQTFDVTVYFDGDVIDTMTDVVLNAGERDTLTCTWNTTGITIGTYTISAEATIVSGEEDTADNLYVNGEVEVTGVPPPSISSCDSIGNKKDLFMPEESVYACGDNYDEKESITIYVVPNGGPYTSNASIYNITAQADVSGVLGPTDLGTFLPGEYDIWIDRNGNNILDKEMESVDTFGATSGFFVIPEYLLGTILGLAGCFAAFAVFHISKRRNS